MIQVTPQIRILVALEPTDFRQGIDGLARVCKQALKQNPFNGAMFVFRKSFYLGRHEVTIRQWTAVMGGHPSECEGQANSPVTNVGPRGCLQFCHEMSTKTGKRFRLWTEAEWERACRAGTETKYSFGNAAGALGRYAWFGIALRVLA